MHINKILAKLLGGGAKGGATLQIIFTEALVLKIGSTRKFSFQEVEPLLITYYLV